MAGLRTPLSTLHVQPHDRPRMTRGRCGSLLLHRNGLAPSAPCRSPGAPDFGPAAGTSTGSDADLRNVETLDTDQPSSPPALSTDASGQCRTSIHIQLYPCGFFNAA